MLYAHDIITYSTDVLFSVYLYIKHHASERDVEEHN